MWKRRYWRWRGGWRGGCRCDDSFGASLRRSSGKHANKEPPPPLLAAPGRASLVETDDDAPDSSLVTSGASAFFFLLRKRREKAEEEVCSPATTLEELVPSLAACMVSRFRFSFFFLDQAHGDIVAAAAARRVVIRAGLFQNGERERFRGGGGERDGNQKSETSKLISQ